MHNENAMAERGHCAAKTTDRKLAHFDRHLPVKSSTGTRHNVPKKSPLEVDKKEKEAVLLVF